MLIINFLRRLLGFLILASFYVSIQSFLKLLIAIQGHHLKIYAFVVSQYMSQLVLKNFNIKVRTNLDASQIAQLFLCNHISYLDAVIIFSQIRGQFLTSVEIKKSFGLGHLCKLSHCLYTNRESFWEIKSEIDAIAQSLRSGTNVVLFPEGTTSSGHSLKPFKSSLIEAAILSGVEVLPLTINYTHFNDHETLLEDRDYFAWYGTMDFLPHFLRLCTIKGMRVELIAQPAITSQDAKHNRKILTTVAKKSIEESFKPIPIVT